MTAARPPERPISGRAEMRTGGVDILPGAGRSRSPADDRASSRAIATYGCESPTHKSLPAFPLGT